MMQHQPASPLPNAAFLASMQVGDLMKATSRLYDILEQEQEILAQRRYKDLAKFADEKLQLAKTLEAYQRVLSVDDSLLSTADQPTRQALAGVAQGLTTTLQDNLKKTALARSVNQRVMETITEAVSAHARVPVYGKRGQMAKTAAQPPVSINLNQKA